MIKFIKKISGFLRDDIWHKDDHEYRSGFMRRFVGHLKVFIFTISSYGKNNLIVRAAGLSYYTLMSIVPLAAVIFGIAKGFMFDSRIVEYLYTRFPQYEMLISQLMDFAYNMLERTKGGLIASIGFVVLLWAVVRVFSNVEDAFNYIWEVRKSRRITRKVSDYIAVMISAPILWMLFMLARERVESAVAGIVSGTFLSPLLTFLQILIPFLSAWILHTVLYYVMPNTKVKFSAAFKGGIIAGTVFYLFQMGYFWFQATLSNYNAIYGSFAALPMLLIWMNVSWQIVMFGAELSFGYQNIEKFEYERESSKVSYDYRKKIMLLVMHRIGYNFIKGREQMDSDQLATVLNIPVRIIRDALFDLEEAKLVVTTEDDVQKVVRYYPARDVRSMRVYDVIKAVESTGVQHLNMEEYDELRSLNDVVGKIEQLVECAPENVYLMDIKFASCE